MHFFKILSCSILLLILNTGHAFSMSLNDSIHNRALQSENEKSKAIHRFGIEIHPGYIAPTNKFLRNHNKQKEPINFGISGHLKYAFHFKKGSKMDRLYPHAYQGIGVSYSTFFASELGNPFGCYAFQGSRIAEFRKGLTLDYEWNFGVTFGWHEYHPANNRYNHVIGTDIDAYMNLGIMLNWQISPNYHLSGGLAMSHFSNANTHYPNQGLNQIEARLGVIRTFGETNDKAEFKPTTQPSIRIARHMSYDLIAYGAFRVREINKNNIKYIPDHEFGVFGLNFTPMYHWNNSLSTGVSLDLQYDDSSNLENHIAHLDETNISFHNQPFHEKLSAGISLRGEWAMPIFAINAGIGYNVYSKSFDTQRFYQILAMKIFMSKKFFLHIGYQMNQFKDPNNLMLGCGYRFH